MNYNDKKIVIPDHAEYIIKQLNKRGFEAYLVGGCVRDSLLGRTPNDWDITTNALPDDVKKIFEKTYDIGIKHGTVCVAVNNQLVEVTTYRIDGEYSDNRRPDSVRFTSSLIADLARRDFTINAMAYNPNGGLVDHFGGIEDLRLCQIKAVGDADLRFKEDALRMLRTIRFSAQLGFNIEKVTFDAISNNAGLIENISNERIRDELDKILTSSNPEKFNFIHDTGLLKHVMPEFIPCYSTEQNNPYHILNVSDHIMKTVKSVGNSSILRWTMLLHDIGKPMKKSTDEKGIDHFYGHQEASAELAENILTRLRFDKDFIKKCIKLILHHDMDLFDTEKSVRKAIYKIGDDSFLDIVEVQKADIMAQNPEYLDKRIIKTENIKIIYQNIKKANQCLDIKDMAINGHDLVSLGMSPGKELRNMLEYLFECVLEDPVLNEKQKLISMVKHRMAKM